MLGSPDDPGVMYRTMKELFKRMDDAKDEKEFAIAFSYLEVGFCIFLFILFSQLRYNINAVEFYFFPVFFSLEKDCFLCFCYL